MILRNFSFGVGFMVVICAALLSSCQLSGKRTDSILYMDDFATVINDDLMRELKTAGFNSVLAPPPADDEAARAFIASASKAGLRAFLPVDNQDAFAAQKSVTYVREMGADGVVIGSDGIKGSVLRKFAGLTRRSAKLYAKSRPAADRRPLGYVIGRSSYQDPLAFVQAAYGPGGSHNSLNAFFDNPLSSALFELFGGSGPLPEEPSVVLNQYYFYRNRFGESATPVAMLSLASYVRDDASGELALAFAAGLNGSLAINGGFESNKELITRYLKLKADHDALILGSRRNIAKGGDVYADLKIGPDEKIFCIYNLGADSVIFNLSYSKPKIPFTKLTDIETKEEIIATKKKGLSIALKGRSARFFVAE